MGDLLDALRSTPVEETSPNGEPQANFAPAWRWEKVGDAVEGTVLSVDTRANDNNPDGYPIVTLRQEDGTDIAVHGFSTVLKGKIIEAALRPGDIFAAIYEGKKTSGAGRQYHDFRSAHKQAEGAPIPAAAPAPAAPAPAAPAAAGGNPWDAVDDNNPPF